MKLEEFDFLKVQALLRNALDSLGKEPHLFSFRINERTLTQRLSLHLQQIVGIDLSVDCEYNRMWEEDEDIVKRLPWGADQVLTNDDTGRTVYPDIILHIRGKPFANLLVIEAKRNWKADDIPENDMKKLQGFTKPDGDFRYPWGAFINFVTETRYKHAVVVWFASDGKETGKKDTIFLEERIGDAV